MADLGNRTNVDTAINLLLDDAQPNDAIQPSDHNGLLKNILDTLANGLSVTLRTNPETGGQDIEITSGDKLKYKSSTFFNSLVSATLTADRTLTFPDKTDTIATLTDIQNIMNTNGLTLGGNYTHDLSSNNLVFDDGSFRVTNGSLGVLGGFNATHDGATGTEIASFISSASNPVMILDNTKEAVGIGTSGPQVSAILDIESTSKAVLFPRMTTTQRNAIATPIESMFIYNTTTDQFEFRSSGGTWDALGGGGGGNTIYSADDSLTGDRIVNLDSNKLEFKDSTNANSLLILDDNTRATISNTVSGIFAQYAGSSQTGKLSISSTSVIVNAEKFETKNQSGSHTSLDINSNHTNGKISVNNGTGTQLVWSTHNFTLTNAGTRVIRNGQNKAFFTNAFTVFGIDSTTTVAGEDISLQGETVIQGTGTTTGTTLALYDNDTTPNKNAEFKDNGNVSFYNLPTSASGLSSGDVWNDGGTLKIV